MPYERKGAVVYKKDTGKKVGGSKSAKGAKKYLRVLQAVEHGWQKPKSGKNKK